MAAAAAGGDVEAQGAVGVRREEDKRRRVHPRDLAAFLVARRGCTTCVTESLAWLAALVVIALPFAAALSLVHLRLVMHTLTQSLDAVPLPHLTRRVQPCRGER